MQASLSRHLNVLLVKAGDPTKGDELFRIFLKEGAPRLLLTSKLPFELDHI